MNKAEQDFKEWYGKKYQHTGKEGYFPMYEYFVELPIEFRWGVYQKWLRECANLHIYVDTTAVFDSIHPSKYRAFVKEPFQPFKWTGGKYFIGDTFEEAVSKAIDKANELYNQRK